MGGYHMTDSYCISHLLISMSVNLVTASLKITTYICTITL